MGYGRGIFVCSRLINRDSGELSNLEGGTPGGRLCNPELYRDSPYYRCWSLHLAA